MFIYVADGLLSGDLPYADRWDHKGPMIYLVDALGRMLTPGSRAGINLLEMLSFLLCGALAFLTLRPAFGRTAAGIAVISGGVLVAGFLGRGKLTEEWALLPQFAALFLFARIGATPGSRGAAISLLAIGALGAAAFLLRPNLVGLWLAIGAA